MFPIKTVPKTNKSKEKDPILEEIEKDETPIDDKGQPVTPPTEPKMDDLLAKNPDDLTAVEIDYISDHKTDLTPEQLVKVGLAEPEVLPEPTNIPAPEPTPIVTQPIKVPEPELVIEPVEVKEPTEAELRASLASEGIDIDELTAFEKLTAKRNLIQEKKQAVIENSFKTQNQSKEWSKKIDTFLDSTNNDPKYTGLSGHEAEFKQFALDYQGSDIETLLLPAFLHNLPKSAPKRGAIFEHTAGGEKQEKPVEGIQDADLAAKLRVSDPREYARQVKAGKIKLEV